MVPHKSCATSKTVKFVGRFSILMQDSCGLLLWSVMVVEVVIVVDGLLW